MRLLAFKPISIQILISIHLHYDLLNRNFLFHQRPCNFIYIPFSFFFIFQEILLWKILLIHDYNVLYDKETTLIGIHTIGFHFILLTISFTMCYSCYILSYHLKIIYNHFEAHAMIIMWYIKSRWIFHNLIVQHIMIICIL